MNSTVSKGRLAEYHVKRLLEEQGYHYIIRSYASLTPVDMLASNGNDVIAVQVKRGGYISKAEKQRLIEWAGMFQARACLARKRRGRWAISPI